MGGGVAGLRGGKVAGGMFPLKPHHRERSKPSPCHHEGSECFAPVMGRYPFGAAALAVYFVLARRANGDGDSWPGLELIARESGSSERTVQRAIRLLEVLGLIEVSHCYEQGSNRQTSNLYTLLTPAEQPPEIDFDPERWPTPPRPTLLVR